ncbi:TatD family deoxyribonuclease [Pueribacillus theae]|uniref:TatD family deoxyribonuclease n=1 Tax=Pueribacillus theae TaxID=2171751 RepID=A0A2U1K5R0_9BACI|nr:TatD family deoxyribonuclease [Pueribacillus theae]
MIDAHIHLDQYPTEQIADQIKRWKEGGINGVVAVSTDLHSCYHTLSLAERFPDFVYPCLGWHPEQRLPTDKELNELIQLIRTEKHRINGVGEIGLPHYSLKQLGNPPLEPYIELFTILTCEAKAQELPVAVHAVHNKAPLALAVLKEEKMTKAHFHWLKAEAEVLKEIIHEGYFISVTPEVCYRERDKRLVQSTPMGQLLLETDGPWPFSGPFSGKSTTPLFLFDSLEKVAAIKGKSIVEAKFQLRQNIEKLYLSYRGGSIN